MKPTNLIIDICKRHGLTVERTTHNRHTKIYVRRTDNRETIIVCPSSMSDNTRGWKNLEATIRRFAKGSN
jgi:hypothetical protein